MNHNNYPIIDMDQIEFAQKGDESAKIQIINWLKPDIEREVIKYCSDSEKDIYIDLFQEGVTQVLLAIQRFNPREHKVTRKYFKLWIKGGILRHYQKIF